MNDEKFVYLFGNGLIDSDGTFNEKGIEESAKNEAERFAIQILQGLDDLEAISAITRFVITMWLTDEEDSFGKFYSNFHRCILGGGGNPHFMKLQEYLEPALYMEYGSLFAADFLLEMQEFFYAMGAEDVLFKPIMEGVLYECTRI